MAHRRKQYAKLLQQHEHDSLMNINEQINILEWTKSKMTY